jgi:hypothetical protein
MAQHDQGGVGKVSSVQYSVFGKAATGGQMTQGNEEREPREAAAADSRMRSELNGCLPLAPRIFVRPLHL